MRAYMCEDAAVGGSPPRRVRVVFFVIFCLYPYVVLCQRSAQGQIQGVPAYRPRAPPAHAVLRFSIPTGKG